MGRPRKEPLERRSAKLPPVRITDAELAALTLQAASAGVSLTEYVRQRALGGEVIRRSGQAEAQLLSELNRIGVNLNQIARTLNSGQGRDPHHLDHVLGRLVSTLEQIARDR